MRMRDSAILVVVGFSGFLAESFAANCPPDVSAAALKAHPGASVTACRQENEHGKMQYEVKLNSNGKPIELDMSPDGLILITEEPVAVAEVPQAVTSAFHAKYAGANPTRAERQTAADGKVSYEFAFLVKGKKKEATFASDGAFVEEE